VPRTLLLTLGFGPIWTRPATPSRNDCFLRIRDIWATSRIGRVGVWRYRVGLHRPFRGLLSVHARCGPHTRGPQLHEGFNHFVTTMTAPVASHWSDCRVGLAPTGKRLVTTHRVERAVSDRGPGRRSWAESAPTWIASGRTGFRARAALPLRARSRLHYPNLPYAKLSISAWASAISGISAVGAKPSRALLRMARASAGRAVAW
jgi:hypothetical protein